MAAQGPKPISAAERAARLQRVTRIARGLGFVGRVEYRHVFSSSGGAQFGLGSAAERDLLVVYAEGFIRDASHGDFTLDAIIAHERGHQIVCRNDGLQRFLADKTAPATEEILASLVGSLIAEDETDRHSLVLKAVDEAVRCGLDLAEAMELVTELRTLLEKTV